MEYVFQLLIFTFIYITIPSYAEVFVQNPDFEIPPTNLTKSNATTGANSIPGWSVNGTVWYVPSPWGGHAVQLGPNGTISQTIKGSGDDVLHYILSFTVAAQNQDCASNLTALNITLQEGWNDASKLIYMQKNSTRNLWERHALFLGQFGGSDNVTIQIQSVTTNSQQNVTCWPLVDAFSVNRNGLPKWYNGNMVTNGGFEVGPAFPKNSGGDGIILDEVEDLFDSPLQGWSIMGSVKYIDSRHYRVPRGEAAVELLSGYPSGVRGDNFGKFQTKYDYTLNFTVGDANDSCVGDLTMFVQVGWSIYNFTVPSNGTGSAFKQSLKFRADESTMMHTTPSISFYRFNETRTMEGLLCGPVLDSISLVASHGVRNGILCCFTFFNLLLFCCSYLL